MKEIEKKEIDMKSKIFQEEMEKYLKEDKKKKAYGLYLTEDDVNYLKKKIKKPFSQFVNEIIIMISKSFQEMDKLDEEKKKKEAAAKETDEIKKEDDGDASKE